jgi:nicotinamidase-related amidase
VKPFDEHTALLAIDLQVGIFGPGETRVHDADGVLERAAALVNAAQAAGLPILYCQDDAGPGLWEPGSEGWQIHPRVSPPARAIVFRKKFGDAFRGTELDDELRRSGCSRLVICGAMTDFSIRSTLQRALLRGYSVTLVEDAHSTLDGIDAPAVDHIRMLNEEVAASAKRGLPLALAPTGAFTG